MLLLGIVKGLHHLFKCDIGNRIRSLPQDFDLNQIISLYLRGWCKQHISLSWFLKLLYFLLFELTHHHLLSTTKFFPGKCSPTLTVILKMCLPLLACDKSVWIEKFQTKKVLEPDHVRPRGSCHGLFPQLCCTTPVYITFLCCSIKLSHKRSRHETEVFCGWEEALQWHVSCSSPPSSLVSCLYVTKLILCSFFNFAVSHFLPTRSFSKLPVISRDLSPVPSFHQL